MSSSSILLPVPTIGILFSVSELISTVSPNVEIPLTFSVSLILVISNSVLPSTSKSEFRSTFPATVSAPPTVAPAPTIKSVFT